MSSSSSQGLFGHNSDVLQVLGWCPPPHVRFVHVCILTTVLYTILFVFIHTSQRLLQQYRYPRCLLPLVGLSTSRTYPLYVFRIAFLLQLCVRYAASHYFPFCRILWLKRVTTSSCTAAYPEQAQQWKRLAPFTRRPHNGRPITSTPTAVGRRTSRTAVPASCTLGGFSSSIGTTPPIGKSRTMAIMLSFPRTSVVDGVIPRCS